MTLMRKYRVEKKLNLRDKHYLKTKVGRVLTPAYNSVYPTTG